MTKLSDLKVGDKFRFTTLLETMEFVDSRNRDNGTLEHCYWSGVRGYCSTIHDADVELMPQYKPYPDLRVLVGKTIRNKMNDGVHLVVAAVDDIAAIGSVERPMSAEQILDLHTHLDGTPCGELVE